MENIDGGLGFKATLDIKDFNASAEAMEQHIKKVSKSTAEESEEMDKSLLSFAKNGAKYLVTYLVGQGLGSVVQSVIQTRGQFQQLEIAFKTMLGSGTKANMLMNQLVDTAARTPFDLLGVTGSAKQLLAYGIAAEDVNDTLIRLGNIASGLSIPLSDMAYLYGTTMTQGRLYQHDLNQFTGRGIPMVKELAKQFGVTEKEVRNLVSEGKVGFPEVEKVIQSLTNEGGMFYNLMEEQSKSLSGMVSNLGDAWDSALNKIGERNQDLLASGVAGATYLVEHLDEILRIVKAITVAYGSYKAAVVLNTLVLKGYTGIALIDNTVKQAKIALMSTEIFKTRSLTAATKALWATMKANPVGWIVGLLGAAATALTLFKKKEEEATDETIGLARATKRASEDFSKQAGEIDALRKIVEDSNIGYTQRKEALDKLKGAVPGYHAALTEEGRLINNNTVLLDSYLKKLEKEIKLKAAQDELAEAYKKQRLAEKSKADAEKYLSENEPILNEQISKHEQEKKTTGMVAGNSADAAAGAITSFVTNVDQKLLNSVNKAREQQKTAEKDIKDATDAIKELNEEIKTTSLEIDKSNTKTLTYAEQIAEIKNKIKVTEKEIQELRSGSIVKDDLPQEIGSKISELNKLKSDLAILTGEKKPTGGTDDKKKEEVKAVEDEIKEKKEQYQLYFRWVEGMGKDVANERFKDLVKDGASFNAWINSQIQLLEQKRQKDGSLSTADNDRLFAFTAQRDEIAGKKTAMDVFRESISQTIGQAATLAAKLGAIAEAKEKLASGGFNLNPDDTLQAQNELDGMDKDAQKELQDSILNDFKDFEERKNQIVADYSAMRLTNLVQNNNDLLAKINEGEAAALSALEAEQLTASQSWQDLFTNLDVLTAGEIQKLITEIETKMASANLKLAPADYQALMESLNRAKEKIVSLNPYRALGKAFDNYIKACKKLKAAEKENLGSEELAKFKREAQTAAQSAVSSIGAINDTTSAVGGALSTMISSFGNDEVAETVGNVTDALAGAGQAAGGVAQIMSGDILGGIQSIVSGLASIVTAFNKIHDAKNERRIKAMQKEIDGLSESYDKLSESMDRAYSTSKANMLSQQNDFLKQQNELIQQQIKEEEAKKDTDKERIEEWNKQIEENNKTIAENNKYNIVEAIMGTDVRSAIDDFANAYADAWAAGDKAASKSAETVKNLIRTAIIEQLKNKLKPEVEAFMKYMSEALEDGVISDSEEAMLERYQKALEEKSDKYLSQNEKWLKNDEENGSEDALAGAVRSMSEETGGILAGRMNSVVISVAEQISILKNALIYQAQIAQNTRISAEQLTDIKETLNRIENKDSSLLSKGILL